MSLKGKTAIVTGAGSGLGRATALRLAADGAQVLAVDISGDEEEVARSAPGIVARRCDVADPEQVAGLEQDARKLFDGLDILFNNAGIVGQTGPLHEITPGQLDAVLAVNLRGGFFVLQVGLRLMLTSGGGSIVNTASVAGLRGIAHSGPYSVSKGGLIALTRAAAIEYARRGIRVNAIAPGSFDTPIRSGPAEAMAERAEGIPAGRFGDPAELAALVAFLGSDDARYITGQVYVIDGGATVNIAV